MRMQGLCIKGEKMPLCTYSVMELQKKILHVVHQTKLDFSNICHSFYHSKTYSLV